MRATSLGKNGKGGRLKVGSWEIVGKGTQEDKRSRGKDKHWGAKPGGGSGLASRSSGAALQHL